MPGIADIVAIGSTALGTLGSLFGSGTKTNIPPELRQVFDMLLQRSREGLSDEAAAQMLQRIKSNLGNEAGALSALTESRLTRAGAGTGVKETALSRINTQRLRGIGDAATRVELADEEQRQRSLAALAQLASQFGDFTTPTGQGFAQLLGSGLSFLLNRPRGQGNNQLTSGLQGIFDNPFTDEFGSRLG